MDREDSSDGEAGTTAAVDWVAMAADCGDGMTPTYAKSVVNG
jgi:hypothetical protein